MNQIAYLTSTDIVKQEWYESVEDSKNMYEIRCIYSIGPKSNKPTVFFVFKEFLTNQDQLIINISITKKELVITCGKCSISFHIDDFLHLKQTVLTKLYSIDQTKNEWNIKFNLYRNDEEVNIYPIQIIFEFKPNRKLLLKLPNIVVFGKYDE